MPAVPLSLLAQPFRRLRFLGRPAVMFLKLLAVVIPVGVACLGLVYLRLQHGAISLNFLVEPIQRGLNGEMPGLRFGIEDAIVQMAPGGAIEFRLKNVRLTQDDGGAVAFASLASVELSGSALLRGRIAPARLDLLQPRILLFESDTPPVALSFGRALQGHAITMPEPPGTAEPKREGAPIEPGVSQISKAPQIQRQRIDLGRVIAEAAARMRQRVGAASYLETLGLSNATVVLDVDGRQTVLLLPQIAVSMRHHSRRSIVEGSGRMAAGGQTFGYRFRIDDSEKAGKLTTLLEVDGLVPRALARHLPSLQLADMLDLPVSGKGVLELSREGEILSGGFTADLKAGQALLPWLGTVPLAISGGRVQLRYAGDTQQLIMEPSTIEWGGSRVRVKGVAQHVTGPGGDVQWQFALDGIDGVLEAEDLRSNALPLEHLALRATAKPQRGTVTVDHFQFRAGQADVTMAGAIDERGGERHALLNGRIGAMPVAAFKALWPRGLAPQTRQWVATHLVTGTIKGGSFRIANSGPEPGAASSGDRAGRQLTLALEGADLSFEYLKGMPPLRAPRALLRVEGNTAELNVPEGTIVAAPETTLQLRSGRLTVAAVDAIEPLAELSMRIQGPLGATVDLLDRDPIGLLRKLGITVAGLEGKFDGQFNVKIPMKPVIAATDIKIDGKARITEGSARNVVGKYSMQGATINVIAQENGIEANGEMLLGGVVAKVDWRRILGAGGETQPPLRIRTSLDNAERAQLGLDLDDIVQGEVPLEITVHSDAEAPRVHVMADLTRSELMLRDVAWSKPAGRQAALQFDVGKGRAGQTVLRNFRLVGENVAIDGWIAMGADQRPAEFLFPQFSLNTASNLHVQGVLRSDRIWDIKARGATYDGNDIFRSLLSFSDPRKQTVPAPKSVGLDLQAQIDTVQGAGEQILKGVQLRLQKRGRDLTTLEFAGSHRNGRALTARLDPQRRDRRTIVADAADAGAALSLLGLYTKMVGGQGRLEVQLDGKGVVEKTGILNVRGFKILGDAVVSEVLYTPDDGKPAIQSSLPRNRRVVREEFDFDMLRAPFSLGNGQLVIDNAQVTGPLIGATLRGKLDFRSRRMQLGGTYVPLSELNRALSALPILGQLMTGPRGEGVLGITFAIQGPMADPQVILNPFSMVAPGIFREIFQMTPQNPQVTPGAIKQPRTRPIGPQIRASPPTSGPAQPGQQQQRGKPAETVDGWSARTGDVPERR